jgi:hypothetical protein
MLALRQRLPQLSPEPAHQADARLVHKAFLHRGGKPWLHHWWHKADDARTRTQGALTLDPYTRPRWTKDSG